MQKTYTLVATPRDKKNTISYVSTLDFSQSTVELTIKEVNPNGIEIAPEKVRHDIIQREDIVSVKSCKRNIMSMAEKILGAVMILVFLSIGVPLLQDVVKEGAVFQFLLYYTIIFMIIYLCIYFSKLRVITVKLKGGAKYIIPWHGDLMTRASSTDEVLVYEIMRRLLSKDDDTEGEDYLVFLRRNKAPQ